MLSTYFSRLFLSSVDTKIAEATARLDRIVQRYNDMISRKTFFIRSAYDKKMFLRWGNEPIWNRTLEALTFSFEWRDLDSTEKEFRQLAPFYRSLKSQTSNPSLYKLKTLCHYMLLNLSSMANGTRGQHWKRITVAAILAAVLTPIFGTKSLTTLIIPVFQKFREEFTRRVRWREWKETVPNGSKLSLLSVKLRKR